MLCYGCVFLGDRLARKFHLNFRATVCFWFLLLFSVIAVAAAFRESVKMPLVSMVEKSGGEEGGALNISWRGRGP